jgi:hypothetical protein
MAINFICLSVAAIGIGILADHMGLRQAFFWTVISGFLAASLVLLLPRAPGNASQQQSTMIEE